MTEPTPWPATPPAHGSVVLREFAETAVSLALDLGEDPYIPLIGSLPAHPTREEAEAWVLRQRSRHAEGRGFPFVITVDGEAVGTIGLWLRKLSEGIGILGYSVSPRHRRRGFATDAIEAITGFAWTVPGIERIELYIEPWNRSSPPKERAIGARAYCPSIRRSAAPHATCFFTCPRETSLGCSATEGGQRVRDPAVAPDHPAAHGRLRRRRHRRRGDGGQESLNYSRIA
ncbi:GNAT family N-acetyltransferase [Amycolatopsis umgeniensis]|uniref:RimJ/RimL family protein N-acetyltransferase n=1 Tax=Amycolatopsis umgeniensis TaxID=336628 RepID=A0A841B8A2_9PSEU|nr:GNAT family N-acetyltransferase [Amycolatopsis umgeniensis]MBB5854734.1 RimJ/RimL family protein N-acetyltransferase [Amycolatopsis umgeniensis]